MDDWQLKANSTSSRIKYLLDSGLHSDCQFIIDDERFKCHQLILATASPVLEIMFYGSMPEPGPILIEDIKPNIFRILLRIRLMYGNELSIEGVEVACELYSAAKKYMIRFVERMCLEYMAKNLKPENVILLYEFAIFHGEEALETECLKEIRLNAESVLDGATLLHASGRTLMTVFDMSRLNITSEVQLFRAVKLWLKHNGESDAEITRNLVSRIRFLAMSQEEFISDVASTDLLTAREKLDILLRLIKLDLPPMSNGLCEKKSRRKSCRNITVSTLHTEEISLSNCDGSEWMTSIFSCSKRIDLLGVEVMLQTGDAKGEYQEKLMIKIGLADDRPDVIAEGRLSKSVPYNSKKQIFFKTSPTLEPFTEYSIHTFLFQPGVYPMGHHHLPLALATGKGEKRGVDVNFIAHSSWESSHPLNTTILSGVIFSDHTE